MVVLLYEWADLLRAPLRTLLRLGFAFQGGFLVVTACVVGVALGWGLPLLTVLDCFVLGLPLGHAIGRVGCHGNGCCHGRPTRSRLAVRYTHPDAKAVWASGLGGVPLHPVQLYSAGGNLALFAVLNLLALEPRAPGLLAALYLLLGASGRFAVEFLRGIPTRRVLGLSAFQLLCVGLFACGVGLLAWVLRAEPCAALAGLDGLRDGLHVALRHAWYPGLSFLIGLLGFGLQGPRVGGSARSGAA
jgi:prolipoprotein diacylglyceryltransferase